MTRVSPPGKITEVDLSLVEKYDVPGPRYTSYPTALAFSDKVDWKALERTIAEDFADSRDVSLYIHIPFCDTLCWFCGCTTIISRRHEIVGPYCEALKSEFADWTPRHGKKTALQIHFGGGTPTYLSPDELRRLGEILLMHFEIPPEREFGVEIDPRELTREHVRALREIGANRVSMGVQDHNPAVQEAVNRIQPFELTRRVVDWAREEGMLSVNLDLIYGLPHQTADSFRVTLEKTLALDPDRLAVFNYAHVPWAKPHQKILARKNLPPPREKLRILKETIEFLTSHGYVFIGMDHFAREDDEIVKAQRSGTLQRNFQGYSTFGGIPIAGFGMSAISQTRRCYAQNEKNLETYQVRIRGGGRAWSRGLIVSKKDLVRRYVIMNIMCNLRLDYLAARRETGVEIREEFAREIEGLRDLEEDGLIERGNEGILVTERGRLFIRNIAMRFDPTVGQAADRYSRTV
ncbi:MAG: oxygen-independent coproporphyrinogen III oxidase [Candidatus Hydrogenedentota bacterium]|nr:MAG: oxygen-independent coproporphyrinogen III oxidase [Candidatus Hydrogenedentota bacterium]